MTQKLVQSSIYSVLLPETKEIVAANSLIQTVPAVLVFSTVNENPQTNLSLNTSIKAQVPSSKEGSNHNRNLCQESKIWTVCTLVDDL